MQVYNKEKAEEARVRHKYRKAAALGNIKAPLKAVTGLIGPDCAYHLYRYAGKGKSILSTK